MTRPEVPRALLLRPVLSPQGWAHSSLASLAPALGRYSPPLCRGNKMAAAAARARCARIRPPPFAAPWPAAAPRTGGARAPGPRPPSPPGPALSVAAPRAHARTCREHTPPLAGVVQAGAAGATPSSFLLSLCPSPVPGSRTVPGSRGGKCRRLCPYMARRR